MTIKEIKKNARKNNPYPKDSISERAAYERGYYEGIMKSMWTIVREINELKNNNGQGTN